MSAPEFYEKIAAKTAKKVIGEARIFLTELNDALKNNRAKPVYEGDVVVGLAYKTETGEEKYVSKEQILAGGERFKKGVEIAAVIDKKIRGQS